MAAAFICIALSLLSCTVLESPQAESLSPDTVPSDGDDRNDDFATAPLVVQRGCDSNEWLRTMADKDGGMEGETERRADEGEGFADVADKFGKECGNGGRDEAGEDGAGRDEEGQGEKRRVAAGGRGGGEVRGEEMPVAAGEAGRGDGEGRGGGGGEGRRVGAGGGDARRRAEGGNPTVQGEDLADVDTRSDATCPELLLLRHGTHLFPIGFPATPSTSPHHHPPRPLERPSVPRRSIHTIHSSPHAFRLAPRPPPSPSVAPFRPVSLPARLCPPRINFQLLSLPPSLSLSPSQAYTSSPPDLLPLLPPLPTTPLALWNAHPPCLSACTPQLPPRSLISNFFLYPPPPPPPHPHPRHSPLPHGIPCRTFRLSPPPPATTSLSPSGAPFRLGSLPARRCSPLAALLLALHRPASSSGERGSGNAPQSDAALTLCLHAAALPRAALLLAFHRAASATGECTSGDAPQSDAEVAMHRRVMQVSETPPFSRPLASSPPAASSRECGSGDAQAESDACE
ncbi:unnamed protein product [Closterium sp. NIES-54]